VCVVGWGTNQFTPMLLLYRTRLGFSPALVQATFALYAAGLIPGLLVAGPLSDRVGRRRVVLAALALSMAAGAVLIAGAHSAALLSAGRLLVGLASGSAFSTGAAWIKELSAPPYGTAPPGAAARRTSVAMTLGFGLGPLAAGVLAQWGPAPAVLPYVPHLLLASGALALAARTPETVRPAPARAGSGPPSPAARTGTACAGGGAAGVRGLFQPRFVRVVLPLAPWVFVSATVAMAYAPGLASPQVPGFAIVFAALATVATALSGVAATPLARRVDRTGPARLLGAGLAVVIAGLVADAGATAVPGAARPVLVLAAAVVLGCSYGLCLIFGLGEVQRLARPAGLAAMTACFQAFAYAGYAAPYALSLLDRHATPSALLLAVAALAAATLAFTTWQSHRIPARPDTAKEPA
jgi:MFS family permease